MATSNEYALLSLHVYFRGTANRIPMPVGWQLAQDDGDPLYRSGGLDEQPIV